MAGGEGGRSAGDYPFDESKYKGFWKYYNNETPRGRAGAAQINLGTMALIGAFFYLKSKFTKKDK